MLNWIQLQYYQIRFKINLKIQQSHDITECLHWFKNQFDLKQDKIKSSIKQDKISILTTIDEIVNKFGINDLIRVDLIENKYCQVINNNQSNIFLNEIVRQWSYKGTKMTFRSDGIYVYY